MRSRLISIFLSVILSSSPGLMPLAHAQSNAEDITPPTVLHEPSNERFMSNQTHVMSATVNDANGVARVMLFYRTVGKSVFKSVELEPSGNSGLYLVELSAADLEPPGLEYYLEAEDTAGNTLLRGFSFDPLVLNVIPGTVRGNDLASQSAEDVKKSSTLSNKWLWIGLGALAVGGLAAAGGGGGSSSSSSGDEVTFSAPIPQ